MDLMLRRDVMLASGASACPYITNGLVFWLDGIKKGPNANAWTDLIGGVVFTPDGATPETNGWGTGSGKKLTNSQSLAYPSSTCTIEVAFTRQGAMAPGGQTDVVSFLDSNSIVLSFSGTYVYMSRTASIGTAIGCSVPGSDANKPYLISAQPKKVVCNYNEYLTNSLASAVGAAGYNSIGSRGNGNYYMTGIVHCIRIYNRSLTTVEMQQNQHIDNQRFQLNIA